MKPHQPQQTIDTGVKAPGTAVEVTQPQTSRPRLEELLGTKTAETAVIPAKTPVKGGETAAKTVRSGVETALAQKEVTDETPKGEKGETDEKKDEKEGQAQTAETGLDSLKKGKRKLDIKLTPEVLEKAAAVTAALAVTLWAGNAWAGAGSDLIVSFGSMLAEVGVKATLVVAATAIKAAFELGTTQVVEAFSALGGIEKLIAIGITALLLSQKESRTVSRIFSFPYWLVAIGRKIPILKERINEMDDPEYKKKKISPVDIATAWGSAALAPHILSSLVDMFPTLGIYGAGALGVAGPILLALEIGRAKGREKEVKDIILRTLPRSKEEGKKIAKQFEERLEKEGDKIPEDVKKSVVAKIAKLLFVLQKKGVTVTGVSEAINALQAEEETLNINEYVHDYEKKRKKKGASETTTKLPPVVIVDQLPPKTSTAPAKGATGLPPRAPVKGLLPGHVENPETTKSTVPKIDISNAAAAQARRRGMKR